MRVALITATPPTVPSGSGTFVATEQLERGLQALGHEVRLIRPVGDPRRWPGFTLHRFAFNGGLRPGQVERDADLIVGLDMDGWTLAGRTRRPFVAYLHGVIADEARFEKGAVALSLRLQAWAERRAARRAQLVLATSEYSARTIAALYGVASGRIRVVPPGIDVDRWQAAVMEAPKRVGPPIILCVGHMYPRKDTAALIRAAALLVRKVPDVRVHLVGDGPERTRLERLVAAHGLGRTVIFLGHISFRDLAAEYARCTVFCLPSQQEGFGLVFAEAMAAGKPVVGVEASSTPELIADGVNGFLAPPGDDAALAAALARLLLEPSVRAPMADANRRRARDFSVNRMAARFLEAVTPLVPLDSAPTSRPPSPSPLLRS